MERRRKGLSPLMAVLIALAITIVGGLLLASTFFGYSTAIANRPHVVLESVQLLRDSGGNWVFSATVKNDGVVDATVNIYLGDPANPDATITLASIPPGRTAGGSTGVTFTAEPQIGDTLLVTVQASFADGSSQEFVTSVRASLV